MGGHWWRPASLSGPGRRDALTGGVVAGRWMGSRPETAVPGGCRFSWGGLWRPLGAGSGRCLGVERAPQSWAHKLFLPDTEVKSEQVLPPTLGFSRYCAEHAFPLGTAVCREAGAVWSPLCPSCLLPHPPACLEAQWPPFSPVRWTGRGEGARPRPRSPRLMVFAVTAQAGSEHHVSQPWATSARRGKSAAPPRPLPAQTPWTAVCAAVQRSSDVSCSTVEAPGPHVCVTSARRGAV